MGRPDDSPGPGARGCPVGQGACAGCQPPLSTHGPPWGREAGPDSTEDSGPMVPAGRLRGLAHVAAATLQHPLPCSQGTPAQWESQCRPTRQPRGSEEARPVLLCGRPAGWLRAAHPGGSGAVPTAACNSKIHHQRAAEARPWPPDRASQRSPSGFQPPAAATEGSAEGLGRVTGSFGSPHPDPRAPVSRVGGTTGRTGIGGFGFMGLFVPSFEKGAAPAGWQVRAGPGVP